MKKNIFLILLVIIGHSINAQSTADFKKDSTEKAQQNALLKLEKERLTLEKEKNDIEKTSKKEDVQAQKEEAQTQIDLIKARKDLLSFSTPTPLSGNITISKAETAMAETRALVLVSLQKLIKNFLTDLQSNTCFQGKCEKVTDGSGKKVPIIIFNTELYQAFPDYETLIEQIKILATQYDQQTTEFDGKVNTGEASGDIVGPIAIAQGVLETVINLATLFRTETEFKINDEIITEEMLVSKFRQLDTCCSREYLYPSLFPLKIKSDSSGLLYTLAELDKKRNILFDKIANFRETKIDEVTKKIDGFRKDKKIAEDLLSKTKNVSEKKKLMTKIIEIQTKIRVDSSNIVQSTKKIKPLENNVSKLNETFDAVKTALSAVVDDKSKTTLLRKLLIAECIIDKIEKSDAYSLRLVASGIGTNRIKKNFITSSLKHSSFTEINFMLFKGRELVFSELESDYQHLIKSKFIK